MEVSFFVDITVSAKCAVKLSREATSACPVAVDVCRVVIEEWLLVILKDHNSVSFFVSVCAVLTIVEASIRVVST